MLLLLIVAGSSSPATECWRLEMTPCSSSSPVPPHRGGDTAPIPACHPPHLPSTAMGSRVSPSRSQQPASPITWTILNLERERGRLLAASWLSAPQITGGGCSDIVPPRSHRSSIGSAQQRRTSTGRSVLLLVPHTVTSPHLHYRGTGAVGGPTAPSAPGAAFTLLQH